MYVCKLVYQVCTYVCIHCKCMYVCMNVCMEYEWVHTYIIECMYVWLGMKIDQGQENFQHGTSPSRWSGQGWVECSRSLLARVNRTFSRLLTYIHAHTYIYAFISTNLQNINIHTYIHTYIPASKASGVTIVTNPPVTNMVPFNSPPCREK